ncbi:hypothetical protein SEA_HAUNTER_82 [Microbacterium phage Haunter]|nr:hypothetical protein SEA_HAUNTER_82 [Microbacterium phage Haunter]
MGAAINALRMAKASLESTLEDRRAAEVHRRREVERAQATLTSAQDEWEKHVAKTQALKDDYSDVVSAIAMLIGEDEEDEEVDPDVEEEEGITGDGDGWG